MYDALTVARYVINKCFEEGKPVTNLRLQKLLYFIQGMSYFVKKEALLKEDFHAWQYGPVIPEVYFEYCGYVGNQLRLRYDINNIDVEDEILINSVINSLKPYKDSFLVELSHDKNGPWARHSYDRSVITKNEIKKYFEESV